MAPFAPALPTYEVWTPLFEYERVVAITSVMTGKLRQSAATDPNSRASAMTPPVQGLNCYRGLLAARCRYAEVFGFYSG